MSFVLLVIAGTLAATQPEAAAIIQGAAKAYMGESKTIARLISLIVTEALGEERARTPRPRCRDGLGPSRRLHPDPDHPSPQRAQTRDSAMSKSPRWTHAKSGHSARRRAHVEGSSAPIGLSLAVLYRRLRQIKCRLLVDC
jgi:hypothetical protein